MVPTGPTAISLARQRRYAAQTTINGDTTITEAGSASRIVIPVTTQGAHAEPHMALSDSSGEFQGPLSTHQALLFDAI